MGSISDSSMQPKSAVSPLAALALNDAYWERRAPVQREADVALEWPQDLMLSFSVRMSGHGVGIDRTQMMFDRRYAMQQLMFAHSLCDIRLQNLAARLIMYFEEQQVGRRVAMH